MLSMTKNIITIESLKGIGKILAIVRIQKIIFNTFKKIFINRKFLHLQIKVNMKPFGCHSQEFRKKIKIVHKMEKVVMNTGLKKKRKRNEHGLESQ